MSVTDLQNKNLLFTGRLLKWYRASGRDLPWRRTADPYAVWVSEIMLQQTQVATVLPYYERFLSLFPTVQSLAAVPLDKVLKAWEGLGYYARARHLHRAAREVAGRHHGKFPGSFETILALPGIGRSTAGAIASIAFGLRYPILDGNVKRVLCRYFCIEQDPKEKEVEERLWREAEALLPKKNVSDYAQAIMDLGATVCTPAEPLCSLCPVREGCLAFKKGVQARLPVRGKAKAIPHRDYVAGVFLRGGRVLIRQRPAKGLLGGLWEFPGGEVVREGVEEEIEGRAKRLLAREIPWTVAAWVPLQKIRHTFTHFKMTLHVFSGEVQSKEGEKRPDLKWVPVKRLSDYPFSSAHQKILSVLTRAEGKQRRLFS